MDKMDELRNKINDIDQQMAKLFEQRMEIVKELAKIKKDLNLPVYDQSRETFLLIRNGSYIENRDIRILYFELLNKEFELSKKLQENCLKEN